MKRSPPGKGRPDNSVRELAHDFNNLLTAIIGAADAVLDRSCIDLETRIDIMHMREGAVRGTDLVRRLHPRADHSPAKPDFVSVNETIRATSRLLAHQLGAPITLTLDLDEPGGLARAEPSQLDRALLNLIANARHAMPAGGTVTIRTERRTLSVADQRMPDCIQAGDYVVIAIADTGIGIPPDRIARIFEPGFSSRRPAGGSGLGLSSIRDIVREANGFLAVESAAGRGTLFEIYLPRGNDDVRSPRTLEPRPLVGARVVVLVDDDPLVRRVTERVLCRVGWTVLSADSGHAALEFLKGSACELVISDIAMPGMDGLTLARLMLASQPDLPIILCSGYEHNAGKEGLPANVVFLSKPYAKGELLAAIARAIRDQG